MSFFQYTILIDDSLCGQQQYGFTQEILNVIVYYTAVINLAPDFRVYTHNMDALTVTVNSAYFLFLDPTEYKILSAYIKFFYTYKNKLPFSTIPFFLSKAFFSVAMVSFKLCTPITMSHACT